MGLLPHPVRTAHTETTGTEASATLGFTKNFENPSTNYTNGIDAHLDLGAAQFLNAGFFVGAVGYYYQQLTADSGQLAMLWLSLPYGRISATCARCVLVRSASGRDPWLPPSLHHAT